MIELSFEDLNQQISIPSRADIYAIGAEAVNTSIDCIVAIYQANVDLNNAIASSSHPIALKILKQAIIRKLWTGESLLNSARMVIISESLNNLTDRITNYSTDEFLRNHPEFNKYANWWPIKAAILGIKYNLIEKASAQVNKRI
jgi:hypothetical protein